jgi:hypothetical protein
MELDLLGLCQVDLPLYFIKGALVGYHPIQPFVVIDPIVEFSALLTHFPSRIREKRLLDNSEPLILFIDIISELRGCVGRLRSPKPLSCQGSLGAAAPC